jgi:hypothetical protein
MFRSNGLIDDFVLLGRPADYIAFAEKVGAAISSGRPEVLRTRSWINVEVQASDNLHELFTSLQNQDDFYPSMDVWRQRNILRVSGSSVVLEQLRIFLMDVSGRGEGYSYISEYSEDLPYSAASPEWRLQVHLTD